MKLQEGVTLHFIPTEKFTTNHIKVRFSAPMQKETVAARVLAANILEMGNMDYPTSQLIRKHLAGLYGASFSTSVSRFGEVHIVDLNLSYVEESSLLEPENLTEKILDFLLSCLTKPLLSENGFSSTIFEVEKKNLLSYLESEVEDNFYHADVELNRLFFEAESMQIPRVSTVELVEKVTAQQAYQAFIDMLTLDRIDIFVLGKVDQIVVTRKLEELGFTYRNPTLNFEYRQSPSVIVKEKAERKVANQSVLELGYTLQTVYNDVNYPTLLVFNGLLGGFAHSKLFTKIREKDGLAYTVGSQFNIFTGLLRIYAGIDKENRLKTLRAIHKELSRLKQGKFTEEELDLTKKMLLHAATISEDSGKQLIEQAFRQVVFGKRYMTPEEMMEQVQAVSKGEIMEFAKTIQLQAIYFLEGTE